MRRLLIVFLLMGPALAFAGVQSSSSAIDEYAGDAQVGLASWYGGGEPLNDRVAMGHRFDPEAPEAAMWGVPLGSMVKVTNLRNNRYILVRVTDRGPAKRFGDRIIDLTRGSFSRLAPLSQGLILVTVQRFP